MRYGTTRREAIALGALAIPAMVGASPVDPPPTATLEAPPWISDHLGTIRRHPETFTIAFDQAEDSFRESLGGDLRGTTRDMALAAFASTVAHGLAPYGPCAASSPRDMLAAGDLNCGNYPILAAFLFRVARPLSENRLRWVGWDGGNFGNHGHLIAEGAGGPLFLDPTLAMVARIGIDGLKAGTPVDPAGIRELSRWRYADPAKEHNLDVFRDNVRRALVEGLFPRSRPLFDGYAEWAILRR